MEPYARAYLQFLTCAAGSGPNAEAFVFATRLTRVTRALQTRSPAQAIQRAAAAAPDWSSGTRIGDALREFNDRHGRRGMARGAVVVIISDGWERGDPALVGREMARLARLAYRIVWVNPRVGARGFAPRAGGMAAALEHCDALVSGHSLDALDEVADAIARRARRPPRARAAAAASPPRTRSRGPARRPCPAARSRCRAATARAGATRPRDGAATDERRADEDVHLPGLRAARGPAAPARRPPAGFCDLEEHNALTAHQERQRPEREAAGEPETERGGNMAERGIPSGLPARAPHGKMVLSLTTEPDGNEGRYAQLVADELGVPRSTSRSCPADDDRFGTGHGFNTSPSDGTPGGDRQRDRQDPRQGAAARGRRAGAPPDGSAVGQRRLRRRRRRDAQTIADIALYAHGTGPCRPGVEGGLDAQTVYARLMAPGARHLHPGARGRDPHREDAQGGRGGQGRAQPGHRGHLLERDARARRRARRGADGRRPLAAGARR